MDVNLLVEHKRERFTELEREVADPRLFDNRKRAGEIMREHASIKGLLERWNELEAAIFAADLYRMYNRYAESAGLKTEDLESSSSKLGGLKEVIFRVSGESVFRKLRYESGVHRVQRVPATEAQGRIHTSTATVAV